MWSLGRETLYNFNMTVCNIVTGWLLSFIWFLFREFLFSSCMFTNDGVMIFSVFDIPYPSLILLFFKIYLIYLRERES